MSGSKNSIQAVGSTVTYLQRYTLLAVTGLAAKGQDSDAHMPDEGGAVSDEQAAELKALVKQTSTDVVRFLKYLNCGATTVDEIPTSQYERAQAALQKKVK